MTCIGRLTERASSRWLSTASDEESAETPTKDLGGTNRKRRAVVASRSPNVRGLEQLGNYLRPQSDILDGPSAEKWSRKLRTVSIRDGRTRALRWLFVLMGLRTGKRRRFPFEKRRTTARTTWTGMQRPPKVPARTMKLWATLVNENVPRSFFPLNCLRTKNRSGILDQTVDHLDSTDWRNG